MSDKRFEAAKAAWESARECFHELNMGNYNDDDVARAQNGWMEAMDIMDAAFTTAALAPEPEAAGEARYCEMANEIQALAAARDKLALRCNQLRHQRDTLRKDMEVTAARMESWNTKEGDRVPLIPATWTNESASYLRSSIKNVAALEQA